MNTLTDVLGIRSLMSLTTHLTAHFNYEIDLDCIRVDGQLKIYWAINDNLYKYRIPVTSVNKITKEHLTNIISFINKTKNG